MSGLRTDFVARFLSPALTLSVVILLAATGAWGQTEPQQPQQPQQQAVQPDPDAMLSPAGKEAYKLLQSGDQAGALARLDAAQKAGETTLVDQSLLGTLLMESGRAQEAYDLLSAVAGSSTDPALQFNAGRAALAVGKVEQGMGWLKQSADAVPVSPAGRALGMAYAQQMRCLASLQYLRPWLEAQRGDKEARTIAAMCALELRRTQDATALLEGLPTSEPRIGILRAQLLIQQSDPLSALVILEPLLANHPPEMSADIHRMTTEAYLNSGRARDAVELLAGLPQRGPRLTLLYAEALYRTGDLDTALAELKPVAEAALEQGATHALVVHGVSDYGRILVASGRAEEGLPFLQRAAELQPDHIKTWKALGEALTAAGRRDEARTALETFRKLQTQQSEERHQAELALKDPTGQVLAEARQAAVAGDLEKALRQLRQEIAISPDDIRPHLLYVQILLAAERHGEAVAAAESTLANFPDNPDAAYQLGATRMVAGEQDAAEQSFRRALELDPNHVAALNDLAVLLATRGQKGEAMALARRLLEAKPDDAKAKELLAAISSDASGS